MKHLKPLIICLLALSMLLPSCTGAGNEDTTAETTSTENTSAPETTLNSEPLQTSTVQNPSWGYKAYSVSVANPAIVSAKLVKATGNVILTSYNPGETEVYVHDCFDHKAIINVSVAEDGAITHKANPCTEEYFDAADFGVLPGKSSSGLPDYTDKLQSAINHVYAKGGGTLYLYPGFYNVKLLRMREGVTLKMFSGFTDAREGFTDELANMIKKGEVTVLMVTRIMSSDYNAYGRTGSSNFTISGGVIDNNHSSQSAMLFGLVENITIENMVFKDPKNNHVFQITGCKNVTIRNCVFAGFEWGDTFTRETIQIEQSHPGAHGSNVNTTPQRFENGEIYGSHDVLIDSCYFGPSDELPGHHIAIGHHGTAYEPVCDGLKITNNIFDKCTYAAIRFASLANVDISGNKFIATADSLKFCTESNPAQIILYANTGNVTYENIVTGQKVVKANGFEQPGMHNVSIKNNEFIGEKGTDKRVIFVSGTSINPGINFTTGLIRQDTYDSKPYALIGYLKSTNFFSYIDFSNNKITYTGQPRFTDCLFKFSAVYRLSFENNEVDLEACRFSNKTDGIEGLNAGGCTTLSDPITFTLQSKTSKFYISIPHADGSRVKLLFSTVNTHKLIAGEGGRIELVSDNKGNITVNVIPDEGYTFAGWETSSGKYTEKDKVTVDKALTLNAVFTKN